MVAVNKCSLRIPGNAGSVYHLYLVWFPLFAALTLLPCLAWSQAATPPPASSATSSPPPQNQPEISAHDETPTFKVKVNLVEVRVVVRDPQGHAIGNLKQEDFQLFDNGKPQIISRFSLEKAETVPIVHQENEAATPAGKSGELAIEALVPQRYIAYMFDDVHLDATDLPVARNAAKRQVQSMAATDRAAIFTTSGQDQLDFTSDRDQLIAVLNRLIPRPLAKTGITPCPNVSYYMADLIVNRNDPRAWQVALQDYLSCSGALAATPNAINAAKGEIQAAARQELLEGDQEVRVSLDSLRNVVRRMAALPGQRIVALVSPGFMNTENLQMQSDIAELAVHSSVVINTLDARGLFTGMPDASDQRSTGLAGGQVLQYHLAGLSADSDILADLADTTGGTFFHNNNDLAAGFQRLAVPPEYSYLLGFSPQNLKLDGKYHKLKVSLKPPAKGAIQARKGYYAPKHTTDASEEAKQAIEDEVLSRDEIRDIPVEVHTQFFKPDENSARLSVLVHMDIRRLHYRRANGRNNDDLTIVAALFDSNGDFVAGNQKVLQLHLKDETLHERLDSGITLKNSFDVKPGNYLIRLVVRDEDGQLAAQNAAVEIPQ